MHPDLRFGYSGGLDTCDGFFTGHIVDYDQRRVYSVTAPTSYIPLEHTSGYPNQGHVVRKYLHLLSPKINSMTVDDQGLLVGVSYESINEKLTSYPPLASSPHLRSCLIIPISELTEHERMTRCVDVVTRHGEPDQKLAFKYSLHIGSVNRLWCEMNALARLPNHPNIIPMHGLVTDGDEVDPRIIGFTTRFMPGGALSNFSRQSFKLKWIEQLTSVVDFLNLEYGIMHGDVSPRNMFIDSETDALKLFDFNYTMAVFRKNRDPSIRRRDIDHVVFSVYMLLVGEYFDWQDLNPEHILDQDEWPVKVKLDCDISVVRRHLKDWVAKKLHHLTMEDKKDPPYSNLTQHIDFPPLPLPYSGFGARPEDERKWSFASWRRSPHLAPFSGVQLQEDVVEKQEAVVEKQEAVVEKRNVRDEKAGAKKPRAKGEKVGPKKPRAQGEGSRAKKLSGQAEDSGTKKRPAEGVKSGTKKKQKVVGQDKK